MSKLTYSFKSWAEVAELLEVQAKAQRRTAEPLGDRSREKAALLGEAFGLERAAHYIRHTKIEEPKA
jgi:hypothetical protein